MEPYLIVNAPNLNDDFYLNLIDWSCQNILAVVLNHAVHVWSVNEERDDGIKLCDDLSSRATSVQWSEDGNALAVGNSDGNVEIWDVQTETLICERTGHSSRIGCIAWNESVICSGGRDRLIIQRDIRVPESSTSERTLSSHKQEVCSLKWSPDRRSFASGGNDNSLMLWSMHGTEPRHTFSEHNAAVKALAWSPHHHGLLVSGGGTVDRCLRFWDTLTGVPMQRLDTGSQVCNVAWNKNLPELVTTHGYNINQVNRWRYPVLRPETIAAHPTRVLYLAVSPDGESIVTGGADETLRFYHAFSRSNEPITSTNRDIEWGN